MLCFVPVGKFLVVGRQGLLNLPVQAAASTAYVGWPEKVQSVLYGLLSLDDYSLSAAPRMSSCRAVGPVIHVLFARRLRSHSSASLSLRC